MTAQQIMEVLMANSAAVGVSVVPWGQSIVLSIEAPAVPPGWTVEQVNPRFGLTLENAKALPELPRWQFNHA